MERLEPGDIVTVWKLDRLGLHTRDVLDVVENIRGQGAGFRSLTEGLDPTGPMGKGPMLTIMTDFPQLERDTMIERTRVGLAAAAANNRRGGRPRNVDTTPPRPTQTEGLGSVLRIPAPPWCLR